MLSRSALRFALPNDLIQSLARKASSSSSASFSAPSSRIVPPSPLSAETVVAAVPASRRGQFPSQIRLTGRVIVLHDHEQEDASLQQRDRVAAVGDVRLRRMYLADDTADAERRGRLGRYAPTPVTAKKKNNKKHGSVAEADELGDDEERFSDRGPIRARFASSNHGRRNIYETESRVFSSMHEFGTRFHELDGHELLALQRGKKSLQGFSSGALLVDVRVDLGAAVAAAEHSSGASGFWIALRDVCFAVGRPHLGFSNGDSALNMTRMVLTFFESARGVPCLRGGSAAESTIFYRMRYEEDKRTARAWQTQRAANRPARAL
jgi:hypothetical protein